MITKKLCICVPTYNSPDNIDRFLNEQIAFFYECNVDLHIYDSSTDDKTKNIIKKHHYDNIFYHRIDSDILSNIKVYHIFQSAGNSNYEYIWMIHDHTICRKEALLYLIEIFDKKFDFIVLNMQSNDNYLEEYYTLDDFLVNAAWRLNSYGASVIKTDTFLKNVDWQRISQKYTNPVTLNYSHIGFYFERASELKNVKVCELHFNRKNFLDFRRDKKINWSNETIRICTQCWYSVIDALPDVYKKKKDALDTQDKWFMSKYSLISYKKNKAYSLKHFFIYRKWIKSLYHDDYLRNFVIALLPYRVSLHIYSRKLIKEIRNTNKNNGRIFIYGAGRHAVECACFLKELSIDLSGFIVTDTHGNPKKLLNHQVYKINRQLLSPNTLVIVAVLTSGIKDVKNTLDKYKSDCTKIIEFGE